jgi:hypothetical protein
MGGAEMHRLMILALTSGFALGEIDPSTVMGWPELVKGGILGILVIWLFYDKREADKRSVAREERLTVQVAAKDAAKDVAVHDAAETVKSAATEARKEVSDARMVVALAEERRAQDLHDLLTRQTEMIRALTEEVEKRRMGSTETSSRR